MTKLLGIIGYPLGHSLSPVFQQAALDHAGIDARYEAWPTPPDQVPQRVRSLREPDVLGANVTVPHKEAVLSHLDRLADMARRIGAVNTIVNRNGALEGHNTDVAGFMRALREDAGFDPRGKRVLLLGAGGAAKAAAFGLADAGVAWLAIANRTVERARELVASLPEGASSRALPLDHGALATDGPWDLIVNTTTLGMAGSAAAGETPLEASLIPGGALVYDIVYNPEATPLLAAARKAGARTLGGLPMLIYQGAEAFRLWTGVEAPVGVMFEAARKALRGQ
ncbi:MAG: shikimate dehydrogenase [Chloroflexi bacterium]|nr:shikimate dehydrogenase [Chloroflexota bacterium]